MHLLWFFEQSVARVMAKEVIDPLELVYVEQQHRGLSTSAEPSNSSALAPSLSTATVSFKPSAFTTFVNVDNEGLPVAHSDLYIEFRERPAF